MHWSPGLQTSVSDLEVEHFEEVGKLYTFKYPLEPLYTDGSSNSSSSGEGEYIPVATTRPETILGDTAVCVHPADPRYEAYIGRMCRVPTTGRLVPIIADTYVDMEFGTGALKITPCHDVNDYELGKKHKLAKINLMNRDGTYVCVCVSLSLSLSLTHTHTHTHTLTPLSPPFPRYHEHKLWREI